VRKSCAYGPLRGAAEIGGDLRVRQLPGPQNALGLVKFLLPNAHDVYLHDTAAKVFKIQGV